MQAALSMSQAHSSTQSFRVNASVVIPSCVRVPPPLYEGTNGRLQVGRVLVVGATMVLNGLESLGKPLSSSATNRLRMSGAPRLENKNRSWRDYPAGNAARVISTRRSCHRLRLRSRTTEPGAHGSVRSWQRRGSAVPPGCIGSYWRPSLSPEAVDAYRIGPLR